MELRPADRLILMMLTEIYKKLGISGEIDPDFVQSALVGGHLWALDWRYDLWAGDANKVSGEVVSLVADTLDMFGMIEPAYVKYLSAGNNQLNGDHLLKFVGFDGNNETDHMSVARFFVDDFGRFSEFKGREFNSHSPSVERYRRMISAFAPMRVSLPDHGWKMAREQFELLIEAGRGY